MGMFKKDVVITDFNAAASRYGWYKQDIEKMLKKNFSSWSLTNYKSGYDHLKKDGATIKKSSVPQKEGDAKLMLQCNAMGKLKSLKQVELTGSKIFLNGGGCCTTSAFAAAFKLLEMGLGTSKYPGSRVEIVGQGGGHINGHSWVLVNRRGGRFRGKTYSIANTPSTWGEFYAVDPWLMAFGWEGVWETPKDGEHHSFIDASSLELIFDSNTPEGG